MTTTTKKKMVAATFDVASQFGQVAERGLPVDNRLLESYLDPLLRLGGGGGGNDDGDDDENHHHNKGKHVRAVKMLASKYGGFLVNLIKNSLGSMDALQVSSSSKKDDAFEAAAYSVVRASRTALYCLHSIKSSLKFKKRYTLELYEQKLVSQTLKRGMLVSAWEQSLSLLGRFGVVIEPSSFETDETTRLRRLLCVPEIASIIMFCLYAALRCVGANKNPAAALLQASCAAAHSLKAYSKICYCDETRTEQRKKFETYAKQFHGLLYVDLPKRLSATKDAVVQSRLAAVRCAATCRSIPLTVVLSRTHRAVAAFGDAKSHDALYASIADAMDLMDLHASSKERLRGVARACNFAVRAIEKSTTLNTDATTKDDASDGCGILSAAVRIVASSHRCWGVHGSDEFTPILSSIALFAYNASVKMFNGGDVALAETLLCDLLILMKQSGEACSSSVDIAQVFSLLAACKMKRGEPMDASFMWAEAAERSTDPSFREDVLKSLAKCRNENLVALLDEKGNVEAADVLDLGSLDCSPELLLGMISVQLRTRGDACVDAQKRIRRALERAQDMVMSRLESDAVGEDVRLMLYKAEILSAREAIAARTSCAVEDNDDATMRDLGSAFSRAALNTASEILKRAQTILCESTSSEYPSNGLAFRVLLATAFHEWALSVRAAPSAGTPSEAVSLRVAALVQKAAVRFEKISASDLLQLHDERLIQKYDRTFCDFLRTAARKLQLMGFAQTSSQLWNAIHAVHERMRHSADARFEAHAIEIISECSVNESHLLFSLGSHDLAALKLESELRRHEDCCPPEKGAHFCALVDFAARLRLEGGPAVTNNWGDYKDMLLAAEEASGDAAYASVEGVLKRGLLPSALKSAESALRKRKSWQKRHSAIPFHASSADTLQICTSVLESFAQVGRLWEKRGMLRIAFYYYSKGEELGRELSSPVEVQRFLRLQYELAVRSSDEKSVARIEATMKSLIAAKQPERGAACALQQAWFSLHAAQWKHQRGASKSIGDSVRVCKELAERVAEEMGNQSVRRLRAAIARLEDELLDHNTPGSPFKASLALHGDDIDQFRTETLLARATTCASICASSKSKSTRRAMLTSARNSVECAFSCDMDVAVRSKLFAIKAVLCLLEKTSDAAAAAWYVHASVGGTFNLERQRVLLRENRGRAPDRISDMYKAPFESCDPLVSRECIDKWLPPDLTVCTINVVTELNGVIIARERAHSSPLTQFIKCPGSCANVLSAFADIIERSHGTTRGATEGSASKLSASEKEKWWTDRRSLDDELFAFLRKLEDTFLGKLKVVCAGKPKVRDERMRRRIDSWIEESGGANRVPRDLVDAVVDGIDLLTVEQLAAFFEEWNISEAHKRAGSCLHKDGAEISARMDVSKLKVRELRKELGARSLKTSGLKKELICRLKEAINADRKRIDVPREEVERYPLILVLSGNIQMLPWECFPFLAHQPVSRMPSFPFVLDALRSRDAHSVSPLNGKYLVDPRGDLRGTSTRIASAIEEYQSKFKWTGIVSRRPTEEEFRQSVQHSGIFLYCGHGNAEEFLRREKIAKVRRCAASLLMGCSSGSPEMNGIFDPTTVIHSYLMAGSPCVVANLWDVTDKDLDRFTLALLKQWIGSSGSTIASAISAARSACKLSFLVGAAPIVIGLPSVVVDSMR